MFAAHLAAGLAARSVAPKAPASGTLVGAFLPDLFWIAFAAVGLEPAAPGRFFDGWSHSALSILLQAGVFAACFWRAGPRVAAAMGLAVASHLVLDLPVHPRALELYPHGPALTPDFWAWGRQPAAVAFTHYWWLETGVTLVLLAAYAAVMLRRRVPLRPVAASALTIVGLHFLI